MKIVLSCQGHQNHSIFPSTSLHYKQTTLLRLRLFRWSLISNATLEVYVNDGVDEGVECKEGALEEAMKVDGRVIGNEGCAKIHEPGHLTILLGNSIWNIIRINHLMTA